MVRTLLFVVAFTGSAVAAHAGGFDCANFEKADDGTWHATRPIQIRGPHGVIDYLPDEVYKEGQDKKGLDIAKLLNGNCAKK